MMTCKDCIHSGLCYKENDYENFPDRCGSFISDKVLEEQPQGEWTNTSPYDDKGECPFCCYLSKKYYKFCPNCGKRTTYGKPAFCMYCGAEMKHQEVQE